MSVTVYVGSYHAKTSTVRAADAGLKRTVIESAVAIVVPQHGTVRGKHGRRAIRANATRLIATERMFFHGPLCIIGNVQVEVAILIAIQKRAAGAPALGRADS